MGQCPNRATLVRELCVCVGGGGLDKILFISFKDFIYLFLDKGEGREKKRERNIKVWLPLMCPLLGTWPITQACTLTVNWTGDPLVHRQALNPLSHTSQDWFHLFLLWSLLFPSFYLLWDLFVVFFPSSFQCKVRLFISTFSCFLR